MFNTKQHNIEILKLRIEENLRRIRELEKKCDEINDDTNISMAEIKRMNDILVTLMEELKEQTKTFKEHTKSDDSAFKSISNELYELKMLETKRWAELVSKLDARDAVDADRKETERKRNFWIKMSIGIIALLAPAIWALAKLIIMAGLL